MTLKPLFSRVVVKLSGEALMGPDPFGLHAPTVARMAEDLKAAADLGVQVAVVVGGGNFFRGLQGADKGIERARAEFDRHAGDGDERARDGGRARADRPAGARSLGGRHALALPALFAPGGARPSRQAPGHHAGGGHRQPVLHHRHRRGAESLRTLLRCGDEGDRGRRHLHCRPEEGPLGDALRAAHPRRGDRPNLQIMDTAAFALCRDNGIPIVVFSVNEPGAIPEALTGRGRATYVMP